jgi:class 3 adenylate cyclase
VVTCPSCGQQNPEGARFCNACAAPLQAGEGPLGEERKTVTVVFVDLVGFTAQAERLDPEDVRELLSPYHAHVREELERRDGTVEKFIGDAVMAVFGAPAAHEDDPERAVRAALAIRDWSTEQADLQVRIAVNTGEALVRLDARPAEGEPMVAGDVVNTASRMQSAAPVNGVLVGETTYRATRDAIDYREGSAVQAKGKVEPIAIWEALEPLSRYGVDIAERAPTPLVGRDRELELLRTMLGRVREERATQLVTIVGVPGIGKSRLVRELFELVDEATELITWRQGRCLPFGDSVTFWALGEIVKAETGILENDPPAEAERKLRDAVMRLVPEASETRWLEAELRALVGVSGNGMSAAGAETATAAWRRFLEAVAERGPAVLVFEDLHWADDGLLDFLDDVVDWLRGVPLLLVGTARPELLDRRPGWGGGKPNATTISLQPLPDEDAARLISALLQRPLQLADEQRTLLERAGGNPLFAEQYVRMLSERGLTGELPESVQGVIAARLDALPRSEKELLHEAAVHGKVFWLGGVAAAMRADATDAERLLRALERKTSSVASGARQSPTTRSTRSSTCSSAMSRMARSRAALGGRSTAVRVSGSKLSGAWRTMPSCLRTTTSRRLSLRGRRALRTIQSSSTVRASGHVQQGSGRLRCLRTHRLRSSLRTRSRSPVPKIRFVRACCSNAPARSSESAAPGWICWTRRWKDFGRPGDIEGQAEAATMAARFSWFAGDRSATDRYIADALNAVEDRPLSRARAEALTNRTGFLMLGGSFEESIRVGAEALPLVKALGMEEQRARLHIVVGCARCGLGDTGGLDEIENGIAVAEAAGALEMLGIGYGNLASELVFSARLADARRAWTSAFEVAERYGLGRQQRNYRAEGAYWAYLDGRWDEAVEGTNELLALAQAGDPHYSDSPLLALRGWIEFARADVAAAQHDTRRAVELARASDLQAQSQVYCIGGAVALASGLRDEADELASDLVALGPPMVPALCSPFSTLTDVAWLFHDLDRATEFAGIVLDPDPIRSSWNDAARAICEGELPRAADIIELIGHTASAAYTRLRAAEALAAAGDHQDAAAQRAKAESFYRNVGALRFMQELGVASELVSTERATPGR